MSYAKEIAAARDKMAILEKQSHYESLAVEGIQYHPDNAYPIDAASLEQLADSIEQSGLLHNLVVSVRPDGSVFLLSGERRLRAIRMLQERHPGDETWNFVHALLYTDLTPRQELILMDTANLQVRGSGKEEAEFRKIMNRYIDNVKEEFGLSEKAAVHMTTELGGASGPTVKANRKLHQNLTPELKEKLDSGELNKGDVLLLTELDEDQQAAFVSDYNAAEDPETVLNSFVSTAQKKRAEREEREEQEKEKKKAQKKKTEENPPESIKPGQSTGPVLISQKDVQRHTRESYLDKIDGLKSIVVSLNNPDMVAQMKRLDEAAEQDGEDTILLHINQLICELYGLKRELKDADGDFELDIDPVYGHRGGYKESAETT